MIILSIVCILLAGALLLVMDKLARTQPGGSQSELEGERSSPGGSEPHPARLSPLPPAIFDRELHGL